MSPNPSLDVSWEFPKSEEKIGGGVYPGSSWPDIAVNNCLNSELGLVSVCFCVVGGTSGSCPLRLLAPNFQILAMPLVQLHTEKMMDSLACGPGLTRSPNSNLIFVYY